MGTIPFWLDTVDTSDSFLDTDLGLGLLWMVSTTGDKTGSRGKIVQSSVRLYQAKCKYGHTG